MSPLLPLELLILPVTNCPIRPDLPRSSSQTIRLANKKIQAAAIKNSKSHINSYINSPLQSCNSHTIAQRAHSWRRCWQCIALYCEIATWEREQVQRFEGGITFFRVDTNKKWKGSETNAPAQHHHWQPMRRPPWTCDGRKIWWRWLASWLRGAAQRATVG